MLGGIKAYYLNCLVPKDWGVEIQGLDSCVAKEVNRILRAPGKRVRPLIVNLVADALGLPVVTKEKLATAIELTHCASLIHDDVIDRSPLRRGQETIHQRFHNREAILSGDLILAQTMQGLARSGHIEALIDLNAAIRQLADGEWLQAELIRSPTVHPSQIKTQVKKVALKKTAALFAWAFSAPVKAKGPNEALTQHCYQMGENFGLALQMLDDTWDFSAHNEAARFRDLLNAQPNLVCCHLLTVAPELSALIDAIRQGERGPDELPAGPILTARKEVFDQASALFETVVRGFRAVIEEHGRPGDSMHDYAGLMAELTDLIKEEFAKDLKDLEIQSAPTERSAAR